MATEAEHTVKLDESERRLKWSETHYGFWPLRYEGATYRQPMLGVDIGLEDNSGAIIAMHPLDYIWALWGDDPIRAHQLSRARQAYDLERRVQEALARLERPTPGEIREHVLAAADRMKELFPDKVTLTIDADRFKQQLEWVGEVLKKSQIDPFKVRVGA